MGLQDDVARLVSILVRQHQGGLAEQLRMAAYGLTGDAIGKVAKACGVSPSVIRAWETGAATPTTQEGLAWLTLLYASQRPPFGATLHERAAASEAEPA